MQSKDLKKNIESYNQPPVIVQFKAFANENAPEKVYELVLDSGLLSSLEKDSLEIVKKFIDENPDPAQTLDREETEKQFKMFESYLTAQNIRDNLHYL
jgi:hypothetical protein